MLNNYDLSLPPIIILGLDGCIGGGGCRGTKQVGPAYVAKGIY